jgi:hypothetical protein
MNHNSANGGLSARQKATQKFKKILSSIRDRIVRSMFLMFLTGIFVTLSSCDKKTNGQNAAEAKKDHTAIADDSLNKPKVNIKVNRHYDDKGNVIGFDSTYTSFYSNIRGDTVKMDSLMHSFDSYFNRNHSSFLNNQFNSLFFNDSMRYPDFFHNDFFMKRYELNDDYLKGTMQRMDSIKNHFFSEHSKKRKDPKDL